MCVSKMLSPRLQRHTLPPPVLSHQVYSSALHLETLSELILPRPHGPPGSPLPAVKHILSGSFKTRRFLTRMNRPKREEVWREKSHD
jgi:hypothetical protein